MAGKIAIDGIARLWALTAEGKRVQSKERKKMLMEEKGQDQGSFNVNESIGHIIMGASTSAVRVDNGVVMRE